MADAERHTTYVGSPALFLLSQASPHLGHASGLPVDFQIQSQTAANERHGGRKRVPLGLFPHT